MLSWIFSADAKPPEAYRQMREKMHDLPGWDEAEQALAGCDGSP